MKYFALISTTLALNLAACATAPKKDLEPRDPGQFLARNAAIDAMMKNFARVNFEFDSSLITAETQDALAQNAEIMGRFDELKVEVQGHCDEIGATDYNLALGDRRAESIRKYLVTAGVAPYRVSTISYGEERPLSLDGALEQNRRAEFRVTIGAPSEVHGTVEDETLAEVELLFDDGPIASR